MRRAISTRLQPTPPGASRWRSSNAGTFASGGAEASGGVLGGVGLLGVLSASLLLGDRRYESPQPTLSDFASTFAVRGVEEPVAPRSDAARPLPCASSASIAPDTFVTTPPVAHARARPPLSTLVVAQPPKDEITFIDRARAAVRGGDSKGALAAIAQHAAEFPKPRFGEEAAALRVEAVVLAGDRAATEREAHRFLAAYPRSAYARRIRSAAAIDE